MGVPVVSGRNSAAAGAAASDITALVAYLRELAPAPLPAPAGGAALFDDLGCAACHSTRAAPDKRLHDMGTGLADLGGEHIPRHRQWAARSAQEIARTRQLNPAAGYLHDGRARTVEEAILWHGGEGRAARDAFARAARDKRQAILHYLDPAKGDER
jgi:CxxC motif-containing protein (DUF1111 family)